MKSLLIVALGGALGSAARYRLSGWLLHHAADWRFPVGTFVVNVFGCLAIGMLGGLAVKHDFFSSDARIFLVSGMLGGFTTFSAFGLETFYLLRRGEPLWAGGYVVLSVVVGLLAVGLGFGAIPHRS